MASATSLGALTRLQLARAYAMQGDTAKALAKYEDFLTLWKDADLDISIYEQAKVEYAKLQEPDARPDRYTSPTTRDLPHAHARNTA